MSSVDEVFNVNRFTFLVVENHTQPNRRGSRKEQVQPHRNTVVDLHLVMQAEKEKAVDQQENDQPKDHGLTQQTRLRDFDQLSIIKTIPLYQSGFFIIEINHCEQLEIDDWAECTSGLLPAKYGLHQNYPYKEMQPHTPIYMTQHDLHTLYVYVRV